MVRAVDVPRDGPVRPPDAVWSSVFTSGQQTPGRVLRISNHLTSRFRFCNESVTSGLYHQVGSRKRTSRNDSRGGSSSSPLFSRGERLPRHSRLHPGAFTASGPTDARLMRAATSARRRLSNSGNHPTQCGAWGTEVVVAASPRCPDPPFSFFRETFP